MNWLVIHIAAPLASFGENPGNARRGSADRPTRSALLGLAGAALGIERADAAGQDALFASFLTATRTLSAGTPLTDFHSFQSLPESAGRVATRADALARRAELETSITRRDYRADGRWQAAYVAGEGAAVSLEMLAEAFRRPRFALWAGRRSCPLAEPLCPRVIEAEDAPAAFRAHDAPDRAAFLWREVEPGRKFYLLGPRPVERSPYFEIESKPFEPVFRPGDALAFELRVNATVARKTGDNGPSVRADVAMDRLRAQEAAGADPATRAERRLKAAEGAVSDWLARIGARDGFVLKAARLEAYRVEDLPRRGRNAKLGVSDLSGLLEVTDGEALRARVLAGFGRAKAFGCGLMLLRRVR